MVGASILLLLSCGFVSIQGSPFSHAGSNVNSNTNSNSFRRNYNANANTNMVNPSRFRPKYYRDDAAEAELKTPLDQIQNQLLNEGNEKVAATVSAAAEAALSITRLLGEQMSASASVAVADAIARILTERSVTWLPRFNRRNANYNSNTNTNIIGRGRPYADDQNSSQNQNDLSETEDSPGENLESSGSESVLDSEFLPWSAATHGFASKRYAGFPLAIAGGAFNGYGFLRDNEEEEDTEKSTSADLVVPEEVVEQDVDTVPPQLGGSHGGSRRNSRSHRRSSGYRGNVNSNANSNTFRRNLNHNANSNVNTYRRSNVNSNANTNRISRGRRYRRE